MMKRIALSLILFGGVTLFAGCEKEATNSDPEVFCNEAGCAVSEVNKQKCIEFYNTCIATSPESSDDECIAGALAICK